MPTKRTDLCASEVAMRALLAAQRMTTKDPNFTLSEIAHEVMKLGVSRACAFRHARTAINILAISYEMTEERTKKFREAMSYGSADCRSRQRYARSVEMEAARA